MDGVQDGWCECYEEEFQWEKIYSQIEFPAKSSAPDGDDDDIDCVEDAAGCDDEGDMYFIYVAPHAWRQRRCL